MTAFDPTAIIDPGGWDMIIGLPLGAINTALATEKLGLAFSYSTAGGGQTITLAGTFAPWSIAGGAGQDLALSLPIARGTATVAGGAASPFDLPAGAYDLAGATVTVRTRLRFQGAEAQPAVVRLLFAFDAGSSPQAGVPDGGTLSGGEALPALLRQMLPEMIASCLAEDLQKTSLVFLTLTANMGLAGQPGGGGPATWQYAIASQQGVEDASLAIFYAATPAASLSAAIPASMAPQNSRCVAVLSQAASLRTVVLPAVLYGLNHASAPMPAGFGVGPGQFSPPPVSNAIGASQFAIQPGPAGSNTAGITATGPIELNLGGYSSGATATLSDFACSVAGEDLTISFSAHTPASPSNDYSGSRCYRLAVGQQWEYGQQRFGISLWPAPGSGDTSSDPLQHMIFGAVARGMQCDPLPYTFNLFTNQTIQIETGYLNGGLGLAGPIVPALENPSS
ncbi:MAG TPA: hypothetical protein VF613_14225 [Longimicrobium sp.]